MAALARLPHDKGPLVHMNPSSLRAVVTAAVIAALAPSTAFASTWTVDDDKADCPNARFTSIQAAVDQAAPWDTVVICAGLYLEQSTPTAGNNSPEPGGLEQRPDDHQAADDQGRGREQGDDPARAGARRHARRHRAVPARRRRQRRHGLAPVARLVRRQRELRRHLRRDDRVAATSPPRPASRSSTPPAGSPTACIGTIKPAGPYGYGLIMTNSLQGAEAGVAPPGHAREERR